MADLDQLTPFALAVPGTTGGMPAALVAKDSRILRANPAMESLLRTGDGLTDQSGRLAARNGLENSDLKSVINRAARLRPQKPDYVRISRTGSTHPLLVRISALPPVSQSDEIVAKAVWISVLDPIRPLHIPDRVLNCLYGLTPAEVRVAIGLGRGLRLSDIAEERQVSVGTVRNQVKAAFAKMGINGQSDLVRILAGLAAMTDD
jgi:DNA-binding CsgD family transcriptional regulator